MLVCNFVKKVIFNFEVNSLIAVHNLKFFSRGLPQCFDEFFLVDFLLKFAMYIWRCYKSKV